MIIITLWSLFEFIHRVKALLYVYTYMEVGGRAAQEQLPSSPVCPPDYMKKLPKGVAISSFLPYASQTNTTAWMQEVRLHGSNRYDHMDVGGSECREHILESRAGSGDRVNVWNTFSRDESGTETEKMSGTNFPDRVGDVSG